jgi:hypothetical protein
MLRSREWMAEQVGINGTPHPFGFLLPCVAHKSLGPATGTIEREAAQTMIVRRSPGSRY